MFEELNQARLLKDVPAILVRPLPVIYYYCRYVQTEPDEHLLLLFRRNVEFLSSALNQFADAMTQNACRKLADEIALLVDHDYDALLGWLDNWTLRLAEYCSKEHKEMRRCLHDLKPALIERYKSSVPALLVLLIDNEDDAERVSKTAATLVRSCYYQVGIGLADASDFSERIRHADVVLYHSTRPQKIHLDVSKMDSYRKPVIALSRTKRDGVTDEQAVRHAAQLIRLGYDVLFPPFHAAKLYMAIDRSFVKFHLQAEQSLVA